MILLLFFTLVIQGLLLEKHLTVLLCGCAHRSLYSLSHTQSWHIDVLSMWLAQSFQFVATKQPFKVSLAWPQSHISQSFPFHVVSKQGVSITSREEQDYDLTLPEKILLWICMNPWHYKTKQNKSNILFSLVEQLTNCWNIFDVAEWGMIKVYWCCHKCIGVLCPYLSNNRTDDSTYIVCNDWGNIYASCICINCSQTLITNIIYVWQHGIDMLTNK